MKRFDEDFIIMFGLVQTNLSTMGSFPTIYSVNMLK